jgi:hypothetical protein
MLNDEAVQGMTLNQAADKMRGPVNSKIKLTIMRKGVDKPIVRRAQRDLSLRLAGCCGRQYCGPGLSRSELVSS